MENGSTDKALLLLIKKFEEAKERNSNFSQRAFAQRLGLSSGALSEILKGKRLLTSQVKKKLANKLHLSPLEQLDFFEKETPQLLAPAKLDYHRLTNDQFQMIAEWPHYAILNLIKTKGFKPSVSWIARRLNLSARVAQETWERLFRLNHLKQQGQKVQREYPRLDTSDNVINLSVRKAHLEDLKLMENSLLNTPVELRDHTSMTLVMNKKDLKKAKELIRLFQDKFSEEIECNPAEEVYRLSISLFPLTSVSEEQ
ncbi:MAG: TIGR02147 family protein [Bdellovibrio sp.]|nr:TIGR02147 family protein [Bdellovibrio sp.]